MMKEYGFKVAGFIFSIVLPQDKKADDLLPSFRPFRYEMSAGPADDILFRARTFPLSACRENEENDGWQMLEDDRNDMGHIRLFSGQGGYRFEVSASGQMPYHYMLVDKGFREVRLYMEWSDKSAGAVLNSLMRIAFSQAILPCQALSVHASCVYLDGRSYLFMGKSGTGKSTHSALWMASFNGCDLLNDDNPVIRIRGGQVMAYGTPWSGKTACYRNLSFPVAGMVRLYQASENRFVECKDIEAFVALIPGCSAIMQDPVLYDFLCDTVTQLSQMVKVGILYCLPDQNAAILCHEKLDGQACYRIP